MRKGITIVAAAAFTLLALAQAASAYYSPAKGRFLARDPIGEEGGANLHSFVRNQPISKFDPAGTTEFVGPPLPNGRFVIDFQREDDYASNFQVFFWPEERITKRCACDEIKFTQYYKESYMIAWSVTKRSKEWTLDITGSDGYYIHQTPWSRDSGQLNAEAHDIPGGGKNWAKINPLDFYVQDFRASAVCTKGKDKGKSYGTVEWGHTFKWFPLWVEPSSVTRRLFDKVKTGPIDDNSIGWRDYTINLTGGWDG